MCSDQAAIALLESEEVGSFSTLFKTKDLLSDVFESGQDFDETQSVGSGDRSCHVCSNDRADYCSVFRKAAVCCLSLAQLVFFKQASGHISGQSMVYTIFVFDMHTETVCVRIGCQNQVCIDFFCKFQSQFESFFCFRVRITYRREIAIRQFLLFYYIYMLKAKLF